MTTPSTPLYRTNASRLTLIRLLPVTTFDCLRHGIFLCKCGRKKEIIASRVRDGYTLSCGCLVSEKGREANLRHGMFGTPTYSSWSAMKTR